VGADHVALELLEFVGRDANVGEQSDTSIDGVDRGVAQREFFDHGARAEHGGQGGGGDLDELAGLGYALEVIEGEVGAVEGDHAYRFSSVGRGLAGGASGVLLCLVTHFSWKLGEVEAKGAWAAFVEAAVMRF
jgi:hypothetical protein